MYSDEDTVKAELQALRRLEALSALDVHFALLMCRLAGEFTRELALGAAMVSNGSLSGHTCIDLRERPGLRVEKAASGAVKTPPEPEAWLAGLRSCSAVGRPGEFKPLILDDQGRLYLYRYWRYERLVAGQIGQRAGTLVPGTDEGALRAGLDALFGPANPQTVDWQKIAAASAVLRHLCVISGGPGTGKTSTVIRILALLLQQPGGDRLNIRLSAPTGKAAARLQESVRAAKDGLRVDEQVKLSLPEQASTIHRLLGGRPRSVRFRYDEANPLPVDVLVIDEASMLDIALFSKVLQALAPTARLIMIGDKDQLASVEPGAVLGNLCDFEDAYSEEFRERLYRLTGYRTAAAEGRPRALTDSIVTLRQSYRFAAESGIGRLALAAREGNGRSCVRLLEDKEIGDIGLIRRAEAVRETVRNGYRDFLAAVRAGAPPVEVIQAFGRFRVLCAVREGERGASGLNQLVRRLLQDEGWLGDAGLWYAGRPVIVTTNDHSLSLYNGDVGILLPDKASDGGLRVFFQEPDGRLRTLPPGRLPAHQTVYAMTVHKSQGSEFDSVLLVLPRQDLPVLTRELFYTAVTRARERFDVFGERDLIPQTLSRRTVRVSGLRDALG